MEIQFDEASQAKLKGHLGPDKKLLLTFEDGVGQYSQHAMIHMMVQFTINVVAQAAPTEGYNTTIESNLGPILIKDYSTEDLDPHMTVRFNPTLNTMSLNGDGGVIDSALGFIQDLLVLPDYQHQGIGRELLSEFDDYFKQVDRIVVVTDNAALSAFYTAAGFIPGDQSQATTFVRPRRLLEPKY